MKEVNTQTHWIFELGTKESVNVPIWIIEGFQQRERQDSQNSAIDTFYRPPVTSAQCIFGTKKHPDSAILINYTDDDDYSQVYGLIKEAFKARTKDDFLQLNISENGFISSNDDDNIGYSLYVFDMRYQKNFESAQPIKVEFKFLENLPAGRNAYALIFNK